jgi:hypothetical protein
MTAIEQMTRIAVFIAGSFLMKVIGKRAESFRAPPRKDLAVCLKTGVAPACGQSNGMRENPKHTTDLRRAGMFHPKS